MSRCYQCGKFVCRTAEPHPLCPVCASVHGFSCSHCHSATHIHDMHEVVINAGSYRSSLLHYCISCAEERTYICTHCGCSVETFSVQEQHRSRQCCTSCFCSHWRACEGCGDILPVAETSYGDNGCYCNSCWDRYEGDKSIQSYGYKPPPKFTGKGPLFFGFELEIENDKGQLDNYEAAESLPEDVYCKSDCSINDGFEIVSHPFSWDAWNTPRFQTMIDNILSLRKDGFRSYNTDTCGFHVHMSKAGLSHLQLYKMMAFFENNETFIRAIARRKQRRFNEWSPLGQHSNTKHRVQTAKRKYGMPGRGALNTEPQQTVEIRIFRGTLSKTGFRQNIEFCKALADFAKERGIREMTATIFKGYVADNKKMFKNLYSWLKSHSHYDEEEIPRRMETSND
jgi:hypothetical protein